MCAALGLDLRAAVLKGRSNYLCPRRLELLRKRGPGNADLLPMKANPFAVPVVRLQEERHQRVIDTGIYTVVRHPMYAGFVPMAIGPALWLQSYVAAVLAVVPIAVLAVRSVRGTVLEARIKGLRSLHRRSPLQTHTICLVECARAGLDARMAP